MHRKCHSLIGIHTVCVKIEIRNDMRERESEEEKIRWLVKQTNNHSKNTYFYYFCMTLLLVVLVLSYFLCFQLMKIEAAGKNESNGSEHIWEWHLVHVHAEYLLFQPHTYIHPSIHMHTTNVCRNFFWFIVVIF